MSGKPGMHNKAKVTKDDTLTVASRTNGTEDRFVFSANQEATDAAQEEKLLKDLMEDYSYWRKQPGDFAKSCAAAYKTLINEFTAEETKE
jgi:hypothetical protein